MFDVEICFYIHTYLDMQKKQHTYCYSAHIRGLFMGSGAVRPIYSPHRHSY